MINFIVLSNPENLRIKITEENDTKQNDRQLNESGTFNVSHLQRKPPWRKLKQKEQRKK